MQNNDLCKGRLKQQLFNSNTHWKRKSGPEVWTFHYEPNFSSQGTEVASHGRVLGAAKSPSLLSWLSGRGIKGEMGFPEHWQVQERPSRQSKSKSSFITVTTQVSPNSPLTGKEWVRDSLPEGTGNVLQVLRCLPKSRWRRVVTFCWCQQPIFPVCPGCSSYSNEDLMIHKFQPPLLVNLSCLAHGPSLTPVVERACC